MRSKVRKKGKARARRIAGRVQRDMSINRRANRRRKVQKRKRREVVIANRRVELLTIKLTGEHPSECSCAHNDNYRFFPLRYSPLRCAPCLREGCSIEQCRITGETKYTAGFTLNGRIYTI